MTKTWYNTSTGKAAVFDANEDMTNWPDFQEDEPTGIVKPAITEGDAIYRRNHIISSTAWWSEDGRTMTSEEAQFREDMNNLLSHDNWPILLDSDWPEWPDVS